MAGSHICHIFFLRSNILKLNSHLRLSNKSRENKQNVADGKQLCERDQTGVGTILKEVQ